MISRAAFAKIILFSFLILFAFSLGRGVWKNLENARRTENLREELRAAKGKNEGLKAELSEKEGLGFVEREARGKLGMARVGEKVLILPKKGGEGEGTTVLGSSRKASYFREWARVFGF